MKDKRQRWLVTGHRIVAGQEEDRLLFMGDLGPTVAHLRLGWVMAYDMAPATTIAEKLAIFRRWFEEGLTLAFTHDPEVGGVAIDGTVERPIVARNVSEKHAVQPGHRCGPHQEFDFASGNA